ncbi:MAG: glycerol kinase GlpK [Eubacteriaceae bacterium]|jgi:glycerol kinase|nr:glycerol kinase GlpK [Eubacteriaceae bacterium]
MPEKYYLGIDQGTTGTAALILNSNLEVISQGYADYKLLYPKPGWVEHNPIDIWNAVLDAVLQACNAANIKPAQLECIGIDHEGETVIAWDNITGEPLYNAIVWQDRRTARYADSLIEQYGETIRQKTGLIADAYFSATKIKWIIDNVEGVKEKIKAKRVYAGNLGTWLIWKMTHGKVYVTDCSTASRTMLFNINTCEWDEDILGILDIDKDILPEICDSSMIYGSTDPIDFLGADVPISGLAVDQQAALFGQECFAPGSIKCTYGTGCFMLMNTGNIPVYSNNGLLTTVAWRINGEMAFALDGGVYATGATTQWLRDKLNIISNASQTEQMAVDAKDNGGVYFVPAFTGLAAPHWDSYARGTIVGITGGTTREQIVRAALESTAYQVKDVLDVMNLNANIPINKIRVDGGAVANSFLMQFQADLLDISIDVPVVKNTTALGSAFLGALGIEDITSLNDISHHLRLDKTYTPNMNDDERNTLLYYWHKAVERSKNWIED